MTKYSGINGRALNALDQDMSSVGGSIRPFFTIKDFNDQKEVDKWCEDTIQVCEQHYAPLFQTQLDNLLLYRGIQWLTQERYANFFSDRMVLNNRRGPRVVLNHVQDAVEHWVSKLTRYRPAVSIYPANADAASTDKSLVCKEVLSDIWYRNRIDESNAKYARLAKVTGEAYRFVTWDPHIGEVHPDFRAAEKSGMRVPLLDSSGLPVLSSKGEQIFIDKKVRVGEVRHDVYPGYHVYEMPCNRRDDIDWAFLWYPVHVDKLKAEYPDFADKIKQDNGVDVFQNYGMNLGKGKDEVIVYEFWHRHSRFLEKGRYLKRIKGCILESTDLPYSHGRLPYNYLPDVEIPDQIKGLSFIQTVFPIQHQINVIASLVYKCFVLLAHPKYIMREGTCNIQQLINEATVVEYSEDPPQLLSQNIMPNELFVWMDKLVEFFNKLCGVYTLSTGQAPSGVRAAKALRLIEEQEDKRSYYMAIKYNNTALVEDARMTLSVASDFYEDSDGRVARILGKGNEYKVRSFKVADIAGPYDIRIDNTTALSQSPAARMEEINEIANIRLPPDSVITREQYIKLSDLGALDELKDVATRSYACAKAENEDLRAGVAIRPPMPEEDLIVHWRTHLQDMQGWDFKNSLPEEKQAAYRQHLKETEFLMWEKAFGITNPMTGQLIVMPNPLFQQSLMTSCPQWPVVFKIPAPGALPMSPMPMQQGGAPGPSPVSMGPEQGPLPEQADPTTPQSDLQQGPLQ